MSYFTWECRVVRPRSAAEPTRITIGATTMTYVVAALNRAWRSVTSAAMGMFGDPCSSETFTLLSPAGAPYPWQTAVPMAPFTVLNLGSGNALTSVPLVSWQGLGRPISFSLFHNTLGGETGLACLGRNKWTHSFSRRLVYDGGTDTYILYTDEGGSVVFEDIDGVWYPPPGLSNVFKSRV